MHYNDDVNTANKETVFISYSFQDFFTAKVLAKEIRDQEISVFLSDDNIKSGEKFWDSIKEAIETSDLFVVLITPDSVKRANTMIELGAAVALGKTILGVVSGMSVEDVLHSDTVPGFLKETLLVSIDDLPKLKEVISHA